MLALAACAVPRAAAANGRFPAANQLARRAGSTQDYALRATYGLLLSSDGAKTWDWICENGAHYDSSVDPPIAYSAGGTLMVGTFTGLSSSTDRGCQWNVSAALPAADVSDVTVRPDAPGSALAVFSSFGSDGGPGPYDTRLFETGDDGKTWSELASLDPALLAYSVEVGGAAKPSRVYVTAARNAGTPMVAPVLLVSDDGGKTFVERPVGIDGTKERGVYIAGVDPASADRVYLRTTGSEPGPNNTSVPYNRLRVTEDAGKTFAAIFTGHELLGFALSSDGAKVWVGGPSDGLLVAPRAGFQFQPVSSLPIECLAALDGALWACSKTAFALGVSADDGKSFAPVLQASQVRGPLACAAGASTDVCASQWPAIRDLLRIDAGAQPAPDAGRAGGGCSCDAAPEARGGWIAGALAALVALATLRGSVRRRAP